MQTHALRITHTYLCIKQSETQILAFSLVLITHLPRQQEKHTKNTLPK